MKRSIGGFAVLAGIIMTSPASAQARNCQFSPIQLHHNMTSESRLVVRAGKTCRINFGSTDGAVNETVISQNAKVGTARVEHSRVFYTAKAGFTGADEFTYARKGSDRYGKPSVMSVRIAVQVIP